MKYGITLSNGESQTFDGDEAAGNARGALAIARGAMLDGESVSLWSQSGNGIPMTLETISQPRIFDISEIMN
jgi:hypothetical protein